jgi:hypothetical protein
MAVNDQYSGADPFGGPGGYASSGAPGSAGVSASKTTGGTTGGTIGSVQPRSVMFAPSGPVPEVAVREGDTCAFSDDVPVHPSALLPGDPDQFMTTGAGAGSPNAVNPNAVTVPSAAAQLRAARRSS